MSDMEATNDVYIDQVLRDRDYKIIGERIFTRRNQNGIGLSKTWRLATHIKRGYFVLEYTFKKGKGDERFKVCLLVHRILFKKYHGYIDSKLVINHLDGNKLNNLKSNIELTTVAGNNTHAVNVLGISPIKNFKLNFETAEKIRKEKKIGLTLKQICLRYKISKSTASYIVNNRTWKTKNL